MSAFVIHQGDRNVDGTFKQGVSYRPATQFRPGQHWRPKREHWDGKWLRHEYIEKRRPAVEIAAQQGVTENAILYWLDKFGIPRRSVSEVRKIKHWGACGEANPMYGKTGIANPNWKGGLTPLRQQMYSSSAWRRLKRIVFVRDGGCCRLCSLRESLEYRHIIPFRRAPLLALEPSNVILLCCSCHGKIQNKEKRWEKRLFALIQREEVPVR